MFERHPAVAIRVDASHQIGTGHFMRCLTLANALAARGMRCAFVSRALPGHLQDALLTCGHELLELNEGRSASRADLDLVHSRWLRTSQSEDAVETATLLRGRVLAWLVVDHYALDLRWEQALRHACERLMAIDDLADRAHDCDVLLDQTLARIGVDRYAGKVPQRCEQLLGPRFALLRDEFRVRRDLVLERDRAPRRLLVFFGGADVGGYTARAVEALGQLGGKFEHVDVVIGADSREREAIEARCAAFGYARHVQTQRMAELMAAADVFVGAGGSISWERCCMRLPAVSYAVAANQECASRVLAAHGAIVPARVAEFDRDLARGLRFLDIPGNLRRMSARAGALVDGRGTERVVTALIRRI